MVKLLLEKGADATICMADRQTPIHAVIAGRSPEKQAIELIGLLHKAGADVNVVALINHPWRSAVEQRCTMPSASGKKR